MTNGDKIRSLMDEELAKFLSTDMNIACYYCDRHVSNGGNLECSKCYKETRVSVLSEWFAREYVPEPAEPWL